ncbi:MAG: TrkH family potassium uptake protein [Mogibacterium sp.]|nr:TrkH family potassium uptake protein [Mogibacterium sp.]MBQ6501109.1 TrkH family potassium uptake protein [Mogibacterium sp.]
MKTKVVLHTVGQILLIEAGLLIIPVIVGLIYHEHASVRAFLITAVLTAAAGGLLSLVRPGKSSIYAREGFAITGLSWIVLSFFGCLPFVISRQIPGFIDAFFETVSGFTTTGSSILTDIESLDNAMLFWRSFTHWIGGMGILVFSMIIVPLGGKRSMYILRAEAPGPSSAKLVPKMRDTAAILYGIYFAMSALLLVLLLAGGMPLFDCFINVFGTAGTGGFSNHGASIGHYDSEYFEVVISIFMLMFGVNFNIYYLVFLRRFKAAIRSEEFHWYLGIVAFAVITIAININSLYGSLHQAVRHSFFSVSSIITTTGFGTMDFDQWPEYSRTLLVLLMFIGACAGSTGGGLKVSRIMLLLRTAKRSMRRMIHSRSVESIRFEGRIVEEDTLNTCMIYLTVYCLVTVVSVVLVSLNNFPFEVNVTGVIACINNIGPGLGMVGPAGNFAAFSGLSKLVLAFDMLAGRLELFPVLFLFSVRTWKR